MKKLSFSIVAVLLGASFAFGQAPDTICLKDDAQLFLNYAKTAGPISTGDPTLDGLNLDSLIQTAEVKGTCDSVTITVKLGGFLPIPAVTMKKMPPCSVRVRILLTGSDTIYNACSLLPVRNQQHLSSASQMMIASSTPAGIKISYQVPQKASLSIYNIRGIAVQRFADLSSSGTVLWNGLDRKGTPAPSARYLCVLSSCATIIAQAFIDKL
jgi:hypothetical protein